MPSFSPFLAPSGQQRLPDVRVELPDPHRGPDEPVNRHGVARYAGTTVTMLHLLGQRLDDPPDAVVAFELVAPATCTVRHITLSESDESVGVDLLASIGVLLELSPLPFGIEPALRALRQGLPTFYLCYRLDQTALVPASGADPVIPDDETVVRAGTSLGFVSELAIGVVFQDRAALAPRTWIELLGAALVAAGEEAEGWNVLGDLFAGGPARVVRVLDAAGAPAVGQVFVAVDPPGGTLPASDANGEIDLSGVAGDVTLRWTGAPVPGDESFPMLAHYETGESAGRDPLDAASDAVLVVPAAPVSHLQVLDASQWFAPRSPGAVGLPRFRTRSRVEPLVDGLPTFERLVDDLLASAAPGCGAHMAGWAFEDFALDPGRTDDAGQPVETNLVALASRIREAGGDTRFLVNDLVMIRNEVALEQIALEVAAAAVIVGGAFTVGSFVKVTTGLGLAYSLLGIPGLVLLRALLGRLPLLDIVEKLGETSREFFEAINTLEPGRPNVAILSPYPAVVDDNPEGRPQVVFVVPAGLVDFGPAINQFGTYHQKIQLVKRQTADDRGNRFVAYVGGVDVDRTRVDDPGHHGRATLEADDPTGLNRLVVAPFHDVHARLTGPTVVDVFRTWDDRYAFDRIAPEKRFDPDAPALDPVIPIDEVEAADFAGAGGDHAVQIGRTYYRRDGSTPFAFAPQGETTTVDTLIRAIEAATEFIYIEDQYFTPNARDEGSPEGTENVKTYFDALLEATPRCRRLIVLVPDETTQVFGDLRRRHLFERLREAWGDNLLVGVPQRRPFLAHAGRIASAGRCVLAQPITASDTILRLSPPSRVPGDAPYWLWIDGELMLARQVVPLGADAAAVEVQVERGPLGLNPRWGASTRSHKRGAAVTLSQPQGIYVHSKITIVDDVFVAIGSSNANRRGFYHDGEIHAFAIPEQLKAAADNPARALRTALWAEHLGLPPAMGAPLLEDPIAGFELFRRSFYEGNRFTQFDALDVQAQFGSVLTTDKLGILFAAIGVPAILPDDDLRTLWNDASDPTSFSDLTHSSGPIPAPEEGP